MRSIFEVVLVCLFALSPALAVTAGGKDDRSPFVVYIVRHAEAQDVPGDRPLSDVGHARAARLAEILADEPIRAVYITPTARSAQTGAPVIESHSLEPSRYDPFAFDELAARAQQSAEGGAALIVAHSNTVWKVAAAFGAPDEGDLDHDEFGRLIAIVVTPGAEPRVLRLRY